MGILNTDLSYATKTSSYQQHKYRFKTSIYLHSISSTINKHSSAQANRTLVRKILPDK